jgi:hypothetical protein
MKWAFLPLLCLVLISYANAQIIEPWINGFMSFVSSYPSFLIALALAVVTAAVAKKANLFGSRYGGSDNVIPAAMGLAVFLFTLIGMPSITLPVIGTVGGIGITGFLNMGVLPGLIASLFFIGIFFWAVKSGKFENKTEWLVFFGMLVAAVLAFVLSYLNMTMLSGISSFAAIVLLILFIILFIKNMRGVKGVNLKRLRIKGDKDSKDKIKDSHKVKVKLIKEAEKLKKIKKELIEDVIIELKKAIEYRLSLYAGGKKEVALDQKSRDIINKVQNFLDKFKSFVEFIIHKNEKEKIKAVKLKNIDLDMGKKLREIIDLYHELTKIKLKAVPELEDAMNQFLYIFQNPKLFFVAVKEGEKVSYLEFTWGGFAGFYGGLDKKQLENHYLYINRKDNMMNFLNNAESKWKKIGDLMGFLPKTGGVSWHITRVGQKIKSIGAIKKLPAKIEQKAIDWWNTKGNDYAVLVNLLEKKTNGYMEMLPYLNKVIDYLIVNIKFLVSLLGDASLIGRIAREEKVKLEGDEKKRVEQIKQAVKRAILNEARMLRVLFGLLGKELGEDYLLRASSREFHTLFNLEKYAESVRSDEELMKTLNRLRLLSSREINHIQEAIEEGLLRLGGKQYSWLQGAALNLMMGNRQAAIEQLDKIPASLAEEWDILIALDNLIDNWERFERKEDYVLRRILPVIGKLEEKVPIEEGEGGSEESPKPPKKTVKETEKAIGSISKIDKFTKSANSFVHWILKDSGGFDNWKKTYLDRYVRKPLNDLKNYLASLDKTQLPGYVKHAYDNGFRFTQGTLKGKFGSDSEGLKYLEYLRDGGIDKMLKNLDSYENRIKTLCSAVTQELHARGIDANKVTSADNNELKEVVEALNKHKEMSKAGRDVDIEVTKYTQAMFRPIVSMMRNVSEMIKKFP